MSAIEDSYPLEQEGAHVQKILDNVGIGDLNTGEYTNLVDAVNKLWKDAHNIPLSMAVTPSSWQYRVGNAVSARDITITLSGSNAKTDSVLTVEVKKGSMTIAKFVQGRWETVAESVATSHSSDSGIFVVTDSTPIDASRPSTITYTILVTDSESSLTQSRSVSVVHTVYMGYSQSTSPTSLDLVDIKSCGYKRKITQADMSIVKHSGHYLYFAIPTMYTISEVVMSGAWETFTNTGTVTKQEGSALVGYNLWKSHDTGIAPMEYTVTTTDSI